MARKQLEPTYAAWQAAKQRCLNPRNPGYRKYGGRGIQMCERWLHSYDNFVADMGIKQKHQYLDRINNDGDYEPGNCRWADSVTSSKNRRPIIWMRVYEEWLARVDEWRRNHLNHDCSRAEAVRQLVEFALLQKDIEAFPQSLISRLDRARRNDESRADVIRAAIAREIARRARSR